MMRVRFPPPASIFLMSLTFPARRLLGLAVALILLLGTALPAWADFALPPLPYAAEALEPAIDAATMTIHHDRHHGAYVANLNAQIKANPELADLSLEALQGRISRFPEAVRNNGGGPIRLRLGLVDPPARWKLGHHQHRQPGQPADGSGRPRAGYTAAWPRRVGTRLLPQVPEPPARLHQGLVAPAELERGEPPLPGGWHNSLITLRSPGQ